MEKLKSHKNIIIYILTLAFSVLFITIGYRSNKVELIDSGVKSYRAKVIAIDEVNEKSMDYGYDTMSFKTIRFIAQIKSDNFEPDKIEAFQFIDEAIEINPKEVEIGDDILIAQMGSRTNFEETVWTFIEYYRTDSLILLLGIFFILLILFCRRKGINTIISLIITCLSIFMVFIPSILNGKNIYASSLIICVFIIFLNLFKSTY
jgi:uncharacterized membrane protein